MKNKNRCAYDKVYLPIKGISFVTDSKGKPRMYTSLKNAEKHLQCEDYDFIFEYTWSKIAKRSESDER